MGPMSGDLIATLIWGIWVKLWLPQENGGICMGPMDELWMPQVNCGIDMGNMGGDMIAKSK